MAIVSCAGPLRLHVWRSGRVLGLDLTTYILCMRMLCTHWHPFFLPIVLFHTAARMSESA